VFETELKRESRERYRQCVVRALDDDGLIDEKERAFLEDIRAVTTLNPEEAAEVEREAFEIRARTAQAQWSAAADNPYSAYQQPGGGLGGYSPYSGTGWQVPETVATAGPPPPQPSYGTPYCPNCQNVISESNILTRCRLCPEQFCDKCPSEFTLPVKFKSYRVAWSEERNFILEEKDDWGRTWESPRQILRHAWEDIEPRVCDRCYEKELPLALRALKSDIRKELFASDEETVQLKRAGARETSRVSRLVPDNLFLHESTGMIVAALEGCASCRGIGWCAACEGSGECRKCKGIGTCPTCRGSKTGTPDPDCPECGGSGDCPMPRCKEGVCGYCDGGRRCAQCLGSGEARTDWGGELASRLRQVFDEISAATCLKCHGRLEAVKEKDRWYCPKCETYV
ncbi:MAG TPA: hypothetical protein VI893_02780, partial [Thermoplasmata archaeon]|nr:hypothetical protein [Thermoplasmata archaeon]